MKRRPWAAATILIALVLLGPSLAGCLGSAQATALQHRDAATSRAHAWDPNATLALVLGVEGNLTSAFHDGSWDTDGNATYWHHASSDPHKGDGRTELWLYRYVAADRPHEAYVVVVDQSGKVLRNQTVPRWIEGHALGSWSIDSDQAAQIAANSNGGIAKGTSAASYGVVLVLSGDHDGHAVWTVAGGGRDQNGGGFGIVRIDAVNGTVLSSFGGYRSA